MGIARHLGFRGLTVRMLATRARVNPGSFVYHFRTREIFLEELAERWYAPLWNSLRSAAHAPSDSLAKFELLVLTLAGWAIEHRKILSQLLLDSFAGERSVLRFLGAVAARHPILVAGVILEGQKAGRFVPGNPLHLTMFTMAAVGFPIFLAEGAATSGVIHYDFGRKLLSLATRKDHVRERLRWVIKAIQR
jgi:AcrR family transcriptional regulator